MKQMKSVMLALLLSIVFFSCKKDSIAPEFTITGQWTGKIGNGANQPSGQYALNIKSGGAIERVSANGSASATGTWQLNGDEFTAIYTYSNGTVVTVEAIVNKGQKKLTGNWSNSGGEEGTFYATRDN